jgi:vacuolar-type H+-ATPase subunit E/Vma4
MITRLITNDAQSRIDEIREQTRAELDKLKAQIERKQPPTA